MNDNFNATPHRRYNILTGEWVLVSPHRTKRPWQGKKEETAKAEKISHDPNCYLCATNTRINGEVNPDYKNTFVFTNDFGALLPDSIDFKEDNGLLKAESETGICKVICFSPNHSLTLPDMEVSDIEEVISTWQEEYQELGTKPEINHVQIFENKGSIMGCSNPHPHGQVWAQKSIPNEVLKKTEKQKEYFQKHGKSLLSAYLEQELKEEERIISKNDSFVSLVPFWAVWPYEVMIVPRKHRTNIGELSDKEKTDYAEQLKIVTQKYDKLFDTSFPYSSGIHQAPTNGEQHPEWHFHMSFYPPLLRSATVKKFMVGYEMFGMPQRDITAELAAKSLREL
ncbi:UDP-glucose--hexose-1-phosphate uridylyltransferase [uncultured Maribacter sp.]|uniref:UDP-glucose--hexose-1-phosphate uridylyltransferase n=1 Tax=uncultured Maribacter sp. TaxID=431308 RepID=UPI002610C1D2|nr:UDP-glucose--hexose-1-phosphate uridylyltransferase [uncultured Maribacter sp.]